MDISLIHRREGIIISTIEAINEVGLQNLSTKIIAKKEGVSEGTLFRHFKNKTEIMIAVLDHFSQFDDAIIEASENKNLNPVDTITYFITAYAEYYENYPAITSLVQAYDTLAYEEELSEKVRSILNKRLNFLLKTIDKGKEEGFLQREVKTELIEDLITGAFREICLKWRLSNFTFSIKERTLEMVNIVLKAFKENNR
ncbi:AcrR family transcriptional regulator [Clostridium punense]|uniref:AcrR family transcriptional regulator n=1 Tax=Clostridium punense TaxID=1054297 RepID=A0ABS4KAN2_9CLOT|nr:MULTISPECIES: TetR/AcrR family transcriptional regulator [Clostridium]EQB87241.1 hypothetical protein M918_10320 [Clostridium sp. BL8]MBP2023674.1 AcrR family transcriptional regulator [Clostridium punense]